jgi:hypothetical protein
MLIDFFNAKIASKSLPSIEAKKQLEKYKKCRQWLIIDSIGNRIYLVDLFKLFSTSVVHFCVVPLKLLFFVIVSI